MEEPELELRPPVEVLVLVSPLVLEVCDSPEDEDEDEDEVLLSPPEPAEVVPVVEVAVAVVKPELRLIELSLSELLGLQAMRLAVTNKNTTGEWR